MLTVLVVVTVSAAVIASVVVVVASVAVTLVVDLGANCPPDHPPSIFLEIVMIKKLFAIAMFAALPLTSGAQNVPPSEVSLGAMINLCQSRTDLEAQTFCYGFGEGVYQGSELTKDPKAPKTVCLPAGGVARDEVLAEFIRWAIANPQFHQEKAAASILRYLPIRFPCKG
jgi:Rap1a immunity proteins